MPDTAQDRTLAATVVSVMERQPTNHPPVHVSALEKLLETLRAEFVVEGAEALPLPRYEELRNQAVTAARHREAARTELDRIVFDDGYRLLTRGEEIRPTRNVPPPWIPGFDVLRDGDQAPRLRRTLAHLHALAFPEVSELLELFAYPGKPASIVQTRRDHFLFWRKMNQVSADYVAGELKEFGLVQRQTDDTLCAVWAPPSVLAGIVLRKYLILSEHRVGEAIETEDLLSQAAGVLPPRLFGRHPTNSAWLRELRAPTDVFQYEVGGSRVRLGMEGLCWFAEAGLVSPFDCGRVLRQRRAKESLARVREALIKRMAELHPVNMSTIERELQPA
jgi:hypothetical protein